MLSITICAMGRAIEDPREGANQRGVVLQRRAEKPRFETNVSEAWSAVNATKIGVCAPLVAMNWQIFRTSRLFYVTTEVKGMMSLLGCPRMAYESAIPKVKALSEWRNASRNADVRTARTTAFRDMISILGIQATPDFTVGLSVGSMDIPEEWRRWLAEARKTAKKQPIAFSSMPPSSTKSKGQSTEYGDFRFSLFNFCIKQ
ncbi:unnamed protein product [Hymenolepis diminuta]|uniref:DUF4413 domain-containing protein n=1 Tax=Hymenolepis diminuta TaxID=6216 RepID=A0A0R3SXH9_HYMDI|nr:unnamed protein product [Hymenolepis diminuta]